MVTDYGIAHLRGKSVKARMKALIDIANPKHRDDLAKKAYEIYHVMI